MQVESTEGRGGHPSSFRTETPAFILPRLGFSYAIPISPSPLRKTTMNETRYPRVSSTKHIVTGHVRPGQWLSLPLVLLEIHDLVPAILTAFDYELPYTSG